MSAWVGLPAAFARVGVAHRPLSAIENDERFVIRTSCCRSPTPLAYPLSRPRGRRCSLAGGGAAPSGSRLGASRPAPCGRRGALRLPKRRWLFPDCQFFLSKLNN